MHIIDYFKDCFIIKVRMGMMVIRTLSYPKGS